MTEERRALSAVVKGLRGAMEFHADGTHRQAVYVPQEDLATLLDWLERYEKALYAIADGSGVPDGLLAQGKEHFREYFAGWLQKRARAALESQP